MVRAGAPQVDLQGSTIYFINETFVESRCCGNELEPILAFCKNDKIGHHHLDPSPMLI